ncbi:MAG: flippase-like domain-containing protein [Nitrospira sp.]|nr:flippase-like domain-containing protein [Nitrospira sp.]
MLKAILFVLGALTLSALVWHIGIGRIYDAVTQLGPAAMVLVLLPSLLMYVLEAYGWRVTLGTWAKGVPFWRVLAIRTAGESVNMTMPAYVGGEPLKAYLLNRQGVPLVEGLASVVTAKTTMTIAQILFILGGIGLGFWLLGSSGSAGQTITAGLVSVGLLLFGVGAFVIVQRQGLFSWILNLLRRIGLRIQFLEAREQQLLELDRTIAGFYSHQRQAFLLSTGLFLLGWLAEALEVYVMVLCMGQSINVLPAIAIGALSVFIKGGTFFIPGSLGAQDAGNLFLLSAFGYGEVTGITFALLRRFREFVWIALGLGCLAIMTKGADPSLSQK